jgi:hypothetical protein
MSSSTNTDPIRAYLFDCDDEGLFAVSIDPTGKNIPTGGCSQGWRFNREFALAVRDPVPAPIPPEPILRGIRAAGYYIWREGIPDGTTQ